MFSLPTSKTFRYRVQPPNNGATWQFLWTIIVTPLSGVAHYPDPWIFVQPRQRLKKSLLHVLTVRFESGGVALYSSPGHRRILVVFLAYNYGSFVHSIGSMNDLHKKIDPATRSQT